MITKPKGRPPIGSKNLHDPTNPISKYEDFYLKIIKQVGNYNLEKEISVATDSIYFKQFIEFLVIMKLLVCINCWQFVTHSKKTPHERIGHKIMSQI